MKKLLTTKNIAKIAILSSISYILMLLDFPLPLIPPFYKLDFSEVIVLIGGFSLGPWAVVLIEGIKVLFKAMSGSNTAYVGELASFILGISLCVPASIVYGSKKTKNKALLGLVIGSIIFVFSSTILNYIILLPIYSYFYNLPMDTLILIGNSLISLIHDKITFVLFATLPFNIIKSIVVSLLTMLLYKHISALLKK